MYEIAGPLTRVFLRYVGAALITKAGISMDVDDPDFQEVAVFVVGVACSALTEGWYYLSHKYGWSR